MDSQGRAPEFSTLRPERPPEGFERAFWGLSCCASSSRGFAVSVGAGFPPDFRKLAADSPPDSRVKTPVDSRRIPGEFFWSFWLDTSSLFWPQEIHPKSASNSPALSRGGVGSCHLVLTKTPLGGLRRPQNPPANSPTGFAVGVLGSPRGHWKISFPIPPGGVGPGGLPGAPLGPSRDSLGIPLGHPGPSWGLQAAPKTVLEVIVSNSAGCS